MTIKVLGSSSSGNCYIVDDGGSRLILDAGVLLPYIMRAIEWDTDAVCGCLVTHIHTDHSKSASELVRRGIKTYSCADVADSMVGVTALAGHKAVMVGNYKVVPFHVPHGDAECYAYVIWTPSGNRLLYATDFEYIPFHFRDLRLTHLLVESNYTDRSSVSYEKYEHVVCGHASIDTAVGIVEANQTEDLQRVLICHVSGTEDTEQMRARIQAVTTATVDICRRGETYD